jgi:hypothetical protein
MSTRMRAGVLAVLMLGAIGVILSGAVAWAQDSGCSGGVPNEGYGDGSSGDYTVPPGTTFILPAGMNYRNLTVSAGATLDTRGRTLRVCGVLTNYGTITDALNGGPGGNGGRAGDGSDPNLSLEQAYCGKDSTYCSAGRNGAPGGYGSHAGAGRGGRGGGGGGGGGGAYCAATADANGGNGGEGGHGGTGGGYVIIYAYRFANHNVIQADGRNGYTGEGAPDTYADCGAEYYSYFYAGWHDIAAGGGGGGGGGCGGDGGTVEIHFTHLYHLSAIHADGGLGGAGGGGGLGGTQQVGHSLEHGCAGVEGSGCAGGGECAAGGHGGRGACHAGDYAEDGENGAPGEAGAAGDVVLIRDGTAYLGTTDVARYYFDLKLDPPDAEIYDSQLTMKLTATADTLRCFYFRLDRQAFTIPAVRISTSGPTGPWILPNPKHYWLDDGKTVAMDLNRDYHRGEILYVQVAYAGYPVPRDVGTTAQNWHIKVGMFFEHHGVLQHPFVYTTVEPWYAYLWWPVKDDGDNWNCDKAKGTINVTVPSSMSAVSNGVLDGVDTYGSTKRFRWRTEYDTAAYLFFVTATNYAEHPYTYDYAIGGQSGSMQTTLWLFPEDDAIALNREKWRRTLLGLGDGRGALNIFGDELNFGLYPSVNEKYGIDQCERGWGIFPPQPPAMEHQTCSAQPGNWWHRKFLFPTHEMVTSHELSHQWWGDLITCARWNDIWLNEAFASYCDALWFEHHPFPEISLIPGQGGAETLRLYMTKFHKPQRHDDAVYCEDDELTPGRLFDLDITYNRGAWLMHMLRHVLDPDGTTNRFFQLLRLYRDTFGPAGCATTTDFTALASSFYRASGLGDNLDWFFDQWLYGSGTPAIEYSWHQPTSGCITIRVQQRQQELYGDPLFRLPLDVYVRRGTEWARVGMVWTSAGSAVSEYVLSVAGPVDQVDLDRYDWVLKRWQRPFIPVFAAEAACLGLAPERLAGVNDRCVVAAAEGNGVAEQATIWLSEPAFGMRVGRHALGSIGGDWSVSRAINSRGEVVGDAVDGGGTLRAFLWLPEDAYGVSAGMHPVPGAMAGSHAMAVNDVGMVAGYSGSPGAYRAVLWRYDEACQNWSTVDLGQSVGPSSKAMAVNDDGQIVGGCDLAGVPRAVSWQYDEESGSWAADTLDYGIAYCVNNRGQVGGQNATTQPVIWQAQSGGYVPLPLPMRGARSSGVVYAINDAAEAVGELDGHAVLWRDGEIFDLNDDMAGVTSCLVLKGAWGINEAGTILAWGLYDGDPTPRAFVVTRDKVLDCNGNQVLDACDVRAGLLPDLDGDGIPDTCAYAADVPDPIPPAHRISFSGSTSPVLGAAQIRFTLDRPRQVRLEAFDITGRQVAVLADGRFEAGAHVIAWDGRTAGERAVSPGVYLLRFQSEGYTVTRRLVWLR